MEFVKTNVPTGGVVVDRNVEECSFPGHGHRLWTTHPKSDEPDSVVSAYLTGTGLGRGLEAVTCEREQQYK